MALIDRITGKDFTSGAKISPHAFYGMMREFARGEIDRQFIIDNLLITVGDETDLDWLIGQYQAQPTATAEELWLQGMWALLLMTEIGFPGYTTQAEVVAKITTL